MKEVTCTECGYTWFGDNCGHAAALSTVSPVDLELLVRVALDVVKRRRLRGQSRVYDDPVDLIESVARKYQ